MGRQEIRCWPGPRLKTLMMDASASDFPIQSQSNSRLRYEPSTSAPLAAAIPCTHNQIQGQSSDINDKPVEQKLVVPLSFGILYCKDTNLSCPRRNILSAPSRHKKNNNWRRMGTGANPVSRLCVPNISSRGRDHPARYAFC